MAFWAIEDTDFELCSFAFLVGSSSHFPSFLGCANFGSTLDAFSHVVSSLPVCCVVNLVNKRFMIGAKLKS